MDIEPNNDRLLLPIEVLDLDLRTCRTLKRGNISTLSDILDLGESGLAQIYQLGTKRIQYVLDKLNEFLKQTDGKTFTELQLETQKPYLYNVASVEKPNLVLELVPFIKALLKELKYKKDYEILKRRYGLENSKSYTLQEVGDYFGNSRERVRQIESRAKESIYKALTANFSTAKWQIHQTIIEEANQLFHLLQNYDAVITEDEALKIMQSRYGNVITKNDIGSVRLLLNLSGLEALPKATRETVGISLAPAWILQDRIDKRLLFMVIDIVYHLLLDEVKPVSKFDIFVQVNKSLKKKVEPIYLDYATKVCLEIQKIDEETYEFKFGALPSIADKAYRVLHKAANPLHIRDILREINHLQVKTGGQANVIFRSLQGQLVDDDRFEPIGRSGEWSLSEWDYIAKETYSELMQEFLHLKQTSTTAKEIYDYVRSKRKSVKLSSIQSFLVDQKTIFTRVANGKYGLTAWGMKPMPSERSRDDIAEIHSQIDAAIKKVFDEKNSDKLPLWSVVEGVREITNRSAIAIRNRMSELPYLDFEPHPTHPKRKYLKYLSEGQERSITSNQKQKDHKKLLRDSVQNEIYNFLIQQPENSSPLSTIATHVMKVTGCIKPTFYHYLSKMENIRKSNDTDIIICKLIVGGDSNESLSFPQIDTTTDVDLKDKLIRAVNNLNIDNVDLGLFQLGKIFESELKLFLMRAKSKNIFPVLDKDLKRLVDMINCIERNNVITQKHHLTLLREHRNERAHGDIPNLTERQKLMQYAPFLGDLYIKYIIMINEKRQDL